MVGSDGAVLIHVFWVDAIATKQPDAPGLALASGVLSFELLTSFFF